MRSAILIAAKLVVAIKIAGDSYEMLRNRATVSAH